MAKKRQIIILGSGFIGRHLSDQFSNDGIRAEGFSSKELNLLSAQEVRRKLSGIALGDILVITAAITRLKENTRESMMKNIQMVGNIADFINEHPVGQVIYLSSIDVYGIDLRDGKKITEKNELCPDDYYAISKLTGEFLLSRVCSRKKIPATILRLCAIYGPGDAHKSTIYSFFYSALREKKINIYGDGKNLRDYVYVGDLYKLIKYAISKKSNLTVNVATGQSYSILAIARMVRSSLANDVDIEFRPPVEREARARDLVFDTSRLKKKFSGIRLLDLKKGIPLYSKSIHKKP